MGKNTHIPPRVSGGRAGLFWALTYRQEVYIVDIVSVSIIQLKIKTNMSAEQMRMRDLPESLALNLDSWLSWLREIVQTTKQPH